MQCSRNEFLTAIDRWRDSSCAVHLHTDEVNGAFVVTFRSASKGGVLEFSAHPLLQPLTVDLSNADEFEFVVPEHEIRGTDSELVKQVADEIALARVAGKLVFSMTRLVDPFAGRLVQVPSRPSPRSNAAAVEPPTVFNSYAVGGDASMKKRDRNDPVAVYISEVGTVKPLTKDEETKLFSELAGSGDWDEARENVARRIIEGHLAQVVSIAEKHSASGVPMLDLIQEGNIGLMKAVRSFADSPIGDFTDHAATCINDAIKKVFG